MKNLLITAALTAGILGAGTAYAATAATAPADAPAGSTAQCKDGSYANAEQKKGACAGHKGVKSWWGNGSTAATAKPAKAAAAAPAAAAPAAAAAAPAAAAATTAMAPAAAKPAAKAAGTMAAPAPGGGPGLVWVNTSSKVYHCNGTKYYGTTKQGEYMSEADAKAKGNHADHGKACS